LVDLYLDAILEEKDINLNMLEKLEGLEPYGVGNPRPLFLLNNVSLKRSYPVGKEKKHLRITLDNGIGGIGFGLGNFAEILKNQRVDLAFYPVLNEWNDKQEIQLKLEDLNLREEVDSYPVNFHSDNWRIADKRGCKDITGYLKKLLKGDKKAAVYVNDLSYCKKLREIGGNLFLFSGLQSANKMKKVDELVFLSLPFSLQDMAEMIRLFTGDQVNIHLLFGPEQLQLNNNIINRRLPDAKFLRRFYLYLSAMPEKAIMLENIEKAGDLNLNRRLTSRSLTILTELGLIEQTDDRIILSPVPDEKLDLSDSMSYNDTIKVMTGFKELVELAFAADLFPLIIALQKTIAK